MFFICMKIELLWIPNQYLRCIHSGKAIQKMKENFSDIYYKIQHQGKYFQIAIFTVTTAFAI